MVSGPVAVAVVCPGIGQNDYVPQTGFVSGKKNKDPMLPETIPRVNHEKDT
jgi:hypothetical protein